MKSSLLLYSTILGAFVLAQTTAAEEAAAIHWTEWVLPFTIIAILIALNGLYVASEFAIIGTRPSQMEEMAKDGNKTAAAVLKTLEDPRAQDRYIATAQLGITIASLGLGMYAEPALEHLIEPFIRAVFDLDAWALRFGSTPEDMLHLIGYVLVLSLITYMHVVVGEMVPKSIALSKAARAVLALSPVMRVSQFVLSPLVSLLNSIGTLLLRLLNLPPAKPRVHSPEEIEQIVSESAEGGFINEEEREIIQNIFDFGDRSVGQVMTPRRKVQALPANIPRDDLMNFVANSTHNRFPVYEGDRDHVIGILHMQNLIKQHLNSKNGEFDLHLILNPAPAVPEDTPVED
ncbi:MAG: HlyC/CorC family transporter, partial [Anaerolineales bacterium]|nr:HlyC/CorC family transporter [Anaerolineales bacterium]